LELFRIDRKPLHVTTYAAIQRMRTRILISLAIGLASGFFCGLLLTHFQQDAADFRWAIRMAQDLLAGRNPYTQYQLYPVTATLFGLPFVWMRPEIAAGIFYGASSALLAFGLTRHGYLRLLIFLAYPYWAGILTAQWGPLIMASAFFPMLLPATLAKPQLGLPVALTYPNRRGFFVCAVVVVLSLILMPHWPLLWLGQIRHYDHFFPLLVLPGPLLALAALRFRKEDARLLLLMSVMPQRWFYDSLILWLIPKNRRELIWTVFFSWAPGIWRWYHTPASWIQVGRWTVIFLYLPMLVVLVIREYQERTSNGAPASAI
jgi:hypothetical protein